MARKLSKRQYKAAQLVAAGESDDVIISTFKLRRNTLARWRRLPEFIEAVKTHMENTHHATQLRLHALQSMSVNALYRDLRFNDSKAPELKQKQALIDYCRQLSETLGLDVIILPQSNADSAKRGQTDLNEPK